MFGNEKGEGVTAGIVVLVFLGVAVASLIKTAFVDNKPGHVKVIVEEDQKNN